MTSPEDTCARRLRRLDGQRNRIHEIPQLSQPRDGRPTTRSGACPVNGQEAAANGSSGRGGAQQVNLQYARRPDGALLVALGGDWKLARGIPALRGVLDEIEKPPHPQRVILETNVLAGWDSGLLTFLLAVMSRCTQLGVEVDRDGLPDGVKQLLALATAVPASTARRSSKPEPFLDRVGDETISWWSGGRDALAFIGEAFLSFLRFL